MRRVLKLILYLGIALILIIGIGSIFGGKKSPDAINPPVPPQNQNALTTSTLRKLAEARGLEIGAAMNDFMISLDPIYAEIARKEFNAVTAENHMKWEHIHPAPDRYDFTHADALVEFAQSNDMIVRGHALVTEGQLPGWLTGGNYTGPQLEKIMTDHIKNVAAHYKNKFPGRVIAWDVVNESFEDSGALKTNKMVWTKIGSETSDYIKIAFRAAREADGQVKLFYNDNDIETTNAKSDATYNLLKKLKGEGVPIDGIGFQSHFINTKNWGTYLEKDLRTLEANMKRFADLGLEIHITELDVPLKVDDGITADELNAQAKIYETMLRACLKVSGCTAFMTWGFTDKFSWIKEFTKAGFLKGLGAALPFDENYNKKPAYQALYNALLQNP